MPKSKRSPPSKNQLKKFRSYIKYKFLRKYPLRENFIENSITDIVEHWNEIGRGWRKPNYMEKDSMKKNPKIRGETNKNYLYRLALFGIYDNTFLIK